MSCPPPVLEPLKYARLRVGVGFYSSVQWKRLARVSCLHRAGARWRGLPGKGGPLHSVAWQRAGFGRKQQAAPSGWKLKTACGSSGAGLDLPAAQFRLTLDPVVQACQNRVAGGQQVSRGRVGCRLIDQLPGAGAERMRQLLQDSRRSPSLCSSR